ncbi:hypothetical protein GCM10011386_41340 [Parapedobacter defluvii]|uniref:Uncharacterized protein n=1 Tax=Parapedobacter defluvii TaxID=2045106 RepID=A0ABQ1MRR6_9SPHI|nr:hypothetical protein [Parapedobacter defluvii]GGC44801.1 hypothetical protein GCM10011386_41340 [Parapedobacter defluvii]
MVGLSVILRRSDGMDITVIWKEYWWVAMEASIGYEDDWLLEGGNLSSLPLGIKVRRLWLNKY